MIIRCLGRVTLCRSGRCDFCEHEWTAHSSADREDGDVDRCLLCLKWGLGEGGLVDGIRAAHVVKIG